MFMAYLNIDRLPEMMSISRLLGYEQRAMLSYREADHFGDAA